MWSVHGVNKGCARLENKLVCIKEVCRTFSITCLKKKAFSAILMLKKVDHI